MGQNSTQAQAVIDITSLKHFNEIINGEKKNVIVDFWASWCSPCRVISPYYQKLAIQAPDDVGLYTVNIDEVKDVAKEFKIKAIPTFMRFEGGKKIAEVTGADRTAVEALVSQASQDDDMEMEEGKIVAEITDVEGEVINDVVILKMEKQRNEFKM